MSRPLSDGLPYVGVPTNWFRLPEHKILRAKLGMNAMLIWTELYLSSFEINGYYTRVTNDDIAILAMEYGVRENFIREVLHFLAERSMIDGTLLRSDKVITSRDIQDTFQTASKERGKKRPIEVFERYWLLKPEETRTFIKLCPDEDFSGKNVGSSGKNSPKSGKNRGFAGRKDRIEKERIRNDRRGQKTARRKRSWKNPGKAGRRVYHVMSIGGRAEKLRKMYNEVCVPLGLSEQGRISERHIGYVRDGTLKRRYTMADYRAVFEEVGRSRFLRGGGKGNWRASFGWLINPEKTSRVLAGEYRDFGGDAGKTESAQPAMSSFDTDSFFTAAMARSYKDVDTDGDYQWREKDSDT